MAMQTAPAPINVLFTHFGDDWIRGSERCLLDLLGHLDHSRFRPYVWCNSPRLAAELQAMGITVRLAQFPILFGWQAPLVDWRGYRRLVREGRGLIRAQQIGLLHANSGAPCQWLSGLARELRLPLLTQLHARYLLRERCTLRLHRVSLAVGVSQPVLDGLRADGMGERYLRVIANGVDLARLELQSARDLRHQLQLAPEERLLATVGSLIPRKGVDLLLHMLQRLRQDGYPVRLAVIGDGPQRQELQALAHSLGVQAWVHWLGEQAEPVGLLRAGVELYVSAAREEVFGLVLAEAASAGLAVVAPQVGGIAEVVLDGVTGLLVPAQSPLALAAAVQRLLDAPALAAQMGAAGRQRVVQQFSAQLNAERLQECYLHVLQHPKLAPRMTHWWACARWLLRILRRRLRLAAKRPLSAQEVWQ
jgi:glycosyltransferase involved in cell wall biosynthesis